MRVTRKGSWRFRENWHAWTNRKEAQKSRNRTQNHYAKLDPVKCCTGKTTVEASQNSSSVSRQEISCWDAAPIFTEVIGYISVNERSFKRKYAETGIISWILEFPAFNHKYMIESTIERFVRILDTIVSWCSVHWFSCSFWPGTPWKSPRKLASFVLSWSSTLSSWVQQSWLPRSYAWPSSTYPQRRIPC